MQKVPGIVKTEITHLDRSCQSPHRRASFQYDTILTAIQQRLCCGQSRDTPTQYNRSLRRFHNEYNLLPNVHGTLNPIVGSQIRVINDLRSLVQYFDQALILAIFEA